MREFNSLRSQDVLILLKIQALEGKAWAQKDLARDLLISPGEVSHSLERLKLAKLISEDKKSVNLGNAKEFLIYGVKYCFPAQMGSSDLGMPTAHSAPPMKQKIKSNDKIVWPHAEGRMRGETLSPIYPTAPEAASGDSLLYEYLVLLDSIRLGRAREKEIAAKELEKRFK